MTAPVLYLHIGLPKTGSTWLQDRVFPTLDGIDLRAVPRSSLFHGPGDDPHEARLMASVVRRDPGLWASHGARIFHELIGDGPPKRDLLVSDEAIGQIGRRPVFLAAQLAAMSEAARRVGFARISVLMIVRRQDRWLASHYAQIADRRRHAGQEDFGAEADILADPFRGRHAFGMLIDYAAIHSALAATLGADAVTVLAQETLQTESAEGLARIAAWLDRPEKVLVPTGAAANVRFDGTDGWTLRGRRISTPFGPVDMPVWMGAGRGRRIVLTEDISRKILDSYAGSNAALIAATGLPLAQHGYLGSDAA